jgi:hypothetical protein
MADITAPPEGGITNGTEFDDRITGSGNNDTLNGLAGADVLIGGGGANTLNGGAGNDTFSFNRASLGGDTIADFTQGADRIDVRPLGYADLASVLSQSDQVGDDLRVQFYRGGSWSWFVIENFSASTIQAGDFIFDTSTADRNLTGTFNLDTLIGGLGNDTLDGGDALDFLVGGPGNDTLIGGGGNDRLDGGTGNDRFVYAARGFGNDTISDLTRGPDRINLSALGIGDFASLQPFMSQSGNDTYIAFKYDGVTESLRILNQTATAFRAQDFIFNTSAERISQGGTDNDDDLFGGPGNDAFAGLAGNDRISAGAGVDVASYSGNSTGYTITQVSTGVFEIANASGTDTLRGVEFADFADGLKRLYPGTGTTGNFTTDNPATYMAAIRDFDGNDLGGTAGWRLIGQADVNGDGDTDRIFTNQTIGRFAEVGTAPDGKVYFADHGWAGETRVVGIYVDPLVQSGQVVAGGPNDSQRRFQNDLSIGNIKGVLGGADYDKDGGQEVYFSLTDGTAFLHAYMHADGNIQYANYQSQQQVIDFLTANGWAASTYAGWFG